MTTITENTWLKFTELKNGHHPCQVTSYENQAGEFIKIIYDEYDNFLDDFYNENNYDFDDENEEENSKLIEKATQHFFNLPIEEQLDYCCERIANALACSVEYEITD